MSTVLDDPQTLPARIKARRTMTWLTVGAITMFFAGLLSAYIVQMSAGYWTRITLPTAFVYSSVVVLAGSLTVHLALAAARRGERKPVLPWLLATLVLGLAFTAFQFVGYGELTSKGVHVSPSKMIALGGEYGRDYELYKDGQRLDLVDGSFYLPDDTQHERPLNADLEEKKERTGPYLYVLTFMHLVHLAFGLLSVLIMVRMAALGRYTIENHVGLWAGAIYWHFLAGLWIVIFLFLSLVH